MTFCKLLYHRKCKRRGVGGQKKTNLVNVVCERPLMPFGEDCKEICKLQNSTLGKVSKQTIEKKAQKFNF